MRNDMHIHMILDGVGYRNAIDTHLARPVDAIIRRRLAAYRDAGVTFLRDGGDAWGVCMRARALAPEYGILYIAPAWPIHRNGHYGSFIGRGYRDIREYTGLVRDAAAAGADFIKIMISGLMDFSCCGRLSESSLPAHEIRQLIRIAHDAGLAVMAHCNGSSAAVAAADAGVESIEHGAYLDDEALHAMAENGVVWIPTLSTIANLTGSGRYPDAELRKILDCAMANIRKAATLGIPVGCGSDAGAFRVMHPGDEPHGTRPDADKSESSAPSCLTGASTEEALLYEALGDGAGDVLDRAEELVRNRFVRNI